MKNRFLPINLITTFFGLSLLILSVLSFAGNPGNPELRKTDGSWWESVRANQHTGVVSPMDVLTARIQAEELKFKSTGSAVGLNWLSMGPDNFPGMTWSAIFDNQDPTGLTIIAGAASGGIWKSVNLGLTWTQMAVEHNAVPKVSSLVQAANGTIYAATGVTTCKTFQHYGNGIFRSNALGEFVVINSTVGNPDFDLVTRLAINPVNGGIYAATYGGLYYSENGETWNKILSGYAMDVTVGTDGTVIAAVGDSAYLAPGGDFNAKVTLTTGEENMLPKIGIGWMVFAIAPSDQNVIYASLAAADGKLLNLYVSNDKGNSWSIAFPSNPTYEPFSGYGCYSNTIAVFPNDPNKLYLGGRDMWYGEKVLSTGFYNWERVSFGTYGIYSPYFVPLYHHSYMFRPNYPSQLVIASDGGVSIATIGAEEVTYQTSNKNMRTSQFSSLAFSSQKPYVMGGGPRIGTLVLGYFHPSQVSFESDGYQVWRVDASALNANYQPQPANYGGNGGTCVWSNVDPRVAVYTKTGQNKVRRQDFTDINYYFNFAKGVKADTAGNTPMCLWETFNQGEVFGITRDSSTYVAEAAAVSAGSTIFVQSSSNRLLFPYFVTADIPKGDTITVADPLASRFFIYGDSLNTGKGIFMTKEMIKFKDEPEYYMIFKDVVNTDPVTAMAISADLNTLWAGTSKGRLIRITGLLNAYDSATANIASSQTVLSDTIYSTTPFPDRTVTSISMNPNNSDLVLVTLGNYGNQEYVYLAQNGSAPGPLFNPIQGNLPKAPVYSGLLEMTGTNNAILGTDLGVFSTSNVTSGTPDWAPDMQNIGNVPVTNIRQQIMRDYHIVNYGVIYLASYGRGLWMDTTYSAPVGIEPVQGNYGTRGVLNLNPNPVKDVLNISYLNENAGNLNLLVYDLSGRVLITRDLGYQPKGMVKTTVNLTGLSRGTYIVKVGNGHGKIVKQ